MREDICILMTLELGIQLRKRRDDEEQQTETAVELLPLIQTDKRDNAVLIEQESPLDVAIFEQWQEDNRQFVSTRACQEVEQLVKSHNLVVVTGNSGSGKSAIIQHIALSYRSQGWTIRTIYSESTRLDLDDTFDGSVYAVRGITELNMSHFEYQDAEQYTSFK
eukprot:XP_019927322.1 PREDICTED: uncharacterized protein LOC109620110 [Crassostrea gigas]